MKPTDTPLVLASASPRRRELLDDLGFSFSIVTSAAEDSQCLDTHHPPRDHVAVTSLATRIAMAKAKDVSRRLCPGPLVLAADTVVALLGEPVIGKPTDIDDATEMLSGLMDHEHLVVTGLALINTKLGCVSSAAEVSHVRLEASAEALELYLESGDWQGKAGAYGIQDFGSPVVSCRGSVTNVIGLPVRRVTEQLLEQGLSQVTLEQAERVETAWLQRVFGPEPTD